MTAAVLTFDERRAQPRRCSCGQHDLTGSAHGLGCPWGRYRVGRWGCIWSQPDRDWGHE